MTKSNPKPMTDAELKKAVLAAMGKLRKDGLEPTTRNVYAITGGKHHRVLDMLRDILADEEAKRQRLEEVPEIPEEVQDVFETAWVAAWKAADSSAAEARQMYSGKIAALERECSARRDIIAELEDKLDGIESAKASLDTDLQRALSNVGELRQKLLAAEQRLSERDEILDLLGEVLPRKNAGAPTKPANKPTKEAASSTGALPFHGGPVADKGAKKDHD